MYFILSRGSDCVSGNLVSMFPTALRTCTKRGTSLTSTLRLCGVTDVNCGAFILLSRHFSTTPSTRRMKRNTPKSGDPASFLQGIDKIYRQSMGKNKKSGDGDNKKLDIGDIIQPVFVKPKEVTKDDINVGEELTGKLDKAQLMKKLTAFYRKPTTKALAKHRGMDDRIFTQAFIK